MTDSKPSKVSLTRTLTQQDFNTFAALSGDNNPIHTDPEFSAKTKFGRTVSHGVLLYAILRDLAGRLVPHARQVNQQVMFPAPTYADEPIRFAAEVVADDGLHVTLKMSATRISNDQETCIVETTLVKDRSDRQ